MTSRQGVCAGRGRFAGRPVLVTGGSGMVGRRLVRGLLAGGALVHLLSRRPEGVAALFEGADPGALRVIEGDLLRGGDLTAACRGIDTLFHLASYAPDPSEPDPEAGEQHWLVTVDGTRALLDAAVAAGVRRCIFASSVRAIAESPGQPPPTAYGRAKAEAERLVAEGGGRGLGSTILRLPVLYGSGLHGNLARMIAAIDHGRFPPLPELGNRRSMLHRDDAVRALLLAAERPEAEGRCYLVTDGDGYSSRHIYDLIRAALGLPPRHWSVPLWLLRSGARVGDLAGRLSGRRMPLDSGILAKLTGTLWFDGSEIERELGFRPTQTLAGALPEMVAEYRRERERGRRATSVGR